MAIDLIVDGEKVDLGRRMAYRALMLSGIPNFAFTIGYTNASWTLKADLVADYVCRLLAHMDEHGHRRRRRRAGPRRDTDAVHRLTSGLRAALRDLLPQQGDREPWRLRQNYLHDIRTHPQHPIDDGVLAFA